MKLTRAELLIPKTTLLETSSESVKYIGSKRKIIPHILRLAKKVKAKTVLDGFAGSTRVSQVFAKNGYQVHSNDFAVWSAVLGRCYLHNYDPPFYYQEMVDYLNSLKPVDGWFSQYYGGLEIKKPWQIHNTRKLDAIREEIDNLGLPAQEKCVALTSLMLALDKVDNTLGHFTSCLKDWSPRSYNEMVLKVPQMFIAQEDHLVTSQDIFEAVSNHVDLVYLDPPYGTPEGSPATGTTRYLGYYHVWKTIVLNDQPDFYGKVFRRRDSVGDAAYSVFEDYNIDPLTGRYPAVEAIEDLIEKTNANWIILSCNSSGRPSKEELVSILEKNGTILKTVEIPHAVNVMTRMKHDQREVEEESNTEYLFLLEKS